MKGLRHAGGSADHLGVGGRGGQADENVLPGLGPGAVPGARGALQPVRRAAQGDLPQGGQILPGKKVVHGLGGLPGPVDLPQAQPLQQVRGLQVHHLHLVGGVEDMVGDALRHRDAGDGGHHVVETLQVLNVDGGIDADPRAQQLLHVLVALHVAAALSVGVGQLIHQYELGAADQGGVQIELTQFHALIGDAPGRELLQSVQQGQGLGPGVRLDIPADHVGPGGQSPVGRLQHGVGLPHAGGIAKKDF